MRKCWQKHLYSRRSSLTVNLAEGSRESGRYFHLHSLCVFISMPNAAVTLSKRVAVATKVVETNNPPGCYDIPYHGSSSCSFQHRLARAAPFSLLHQRKRDQCNHPTRHTAIVVPVHPHEKIKRANQNRRRNTSRDPRLSKTPVECRQRHVSADA